MKEVKKCPKCGGHILTSLVMWADGREDVDVHICPPARYMTVILDQKDGSKLMTQERILESTGSDYQPHFGERTNDRSFVSKGFWDFLLEKADDSDAYWLRDWLANRLGEYQEKLRA